MPVALQFEDSPTTNDESANQHPTVSLEVLGKDAGGGQEAVRVQTPEQFYGAGEEIDDFLLRRVEVVAGRIQCVNAGGMLAELVVPEGLVAAVVVGPVSQCRDVRVQKETFRRTGTRAPQAYPSA
jgi:hypothetical protein